jgi:hypothetical protein
MHAFICACGAARARMPPAVCTFALKTARRACAKAACPPRLFRSCPQITGDSVYSKLKWEAGVHRVQRVPATEAAGRVHTSTATVAVMPEVDDVDVTLDMRDVDVKFAR